MWASLMIFLGPLTLPSCQCWRSCKKLRKSERGSHSRHRDIKNNQLSGSIPPGIGQLALEECSQWAHYFANPCGIRMWVSLSVFLGLRTTSSAHISGLTLKEYFRRAVCHSNICRKWNTNVSLFGVSWSSYNFFSPDSCPISRGMIPVSLLWFKYLRKVSLLATFLHFLTSAPRKKAGQSLEECSLRQVCPRSPARMSLIYTPQPSYNCVMEDNWPPIKSER